MSFKQYSECQYTKYVFRCWSLKFKQSDHQFLHQSNVFHHINNILSKSDDGDSEESFSISIQSGFEVMNQASITPLSQKQRSIVTACASYDCSVWIKTFCIAMSYFLDVSQFGILLLIFRLSYLALEVQISSLACISLKPKFWSSACKCLFASTVFGDLL